MNKVILVGRLTADPELRQTPQGVSVTRFTVAVDRRFRREGGQQADFITCVAWRQQAEFICRYFNKGKLIGLDGSIQTSSWEKDGAYQSNFGGGYNAPQPNTAQPQPAEDTGFVDLSFSNDEGSEDDLPF